MGRVCVWGGGGGGGKHIVTYMGHSLSLNSRCDIVEDKRQRHCHFLKLTYDMGTSDQGPNQSSTQGDRRTLSACELILVHLQV